MGYGRRLSLGTRVELVQSLFAIPVPAVIMTLCFVGAGAYILRDIHDRPLMFAYALGIGVSAVRMAILFGYRRAILSKALAAARVFAIEKRFAIGYFAFAACFGIFAARAFMIIGDNLRVPIVALVYGYAAGVSATVSLRPWISLPSIIVAVVPMIATCCLMSGFAYWETALLTTLFLGGGIISMIQRYRSLSSEIAMRRLLESFTRQDDLTDLANSLQLGEHFESAAGTSNQTVLMAVHRVDIDGFWAVNGEHGHVVGDAVLKAVSRRLSRVGRQGCLSVRLANDDFIVLQPDIEQPREADILAHKIVTTLDKPYGIAGRDVRVAIRVGYAVDLQQNADLDGMSARAEEALARAKREAIDVAADAETGWTATPKAA